MKHFEVQSWVDFARNLLKAEQKTAIQKHLDEGCKSCSEEWAIWQQVAEVAKRERSFQPSESAVRAVEAQFALNSPKPEKSALGKLAELMFDTFQQPAMVGVRAGESTGRQLLYKQGSCFIDLRLEQKSGADRVSLVGQVLDSTAPEGCFKHIPVYLLRKRDKVAKTETNEAGEFQLEFKLESDLQLSFGVPGVAVMVPIPESQQASRPGLLL
jgi:hypothetical protein